MAVFPLFAPFRIYKNIHTQNFADNYLMLMPSDWDSTSEPVSRPLIHSKLL